MKIGMAHEWPELLEQWITHYRSFSADGKPASYIPALAQANPSHLGVYIIGADGTNMKAGDWDVTFTMQSISKVISFVAVCLEMGIDKVTEWVDMEPTGDAFNSISRLEENWPGKPFNPLINAGAITVASLLPGNNPEEKVEVVLDLLEKIVGQRLPINKQIYQSEWESAHRNRAIAHYVKEAGFLNGSVDEALECYFKLCSIELNTEQLAMISLVLAADGVHPLREQTIIPVQIARISKALMLTCGMYNASGKFAAFVGVPAKSGVSGGIMAAVPARNRSRILPFQNGCGIGIYGPAIDKYGNSLSGSMLLQHIANEWDLNIF
ncbi:glutaminase [Brevibacillus fulvus]|uniref:Glutaminase n=1 Tax=Brevibacillus fulvus TaxID=1125967 RepID=A0A939BQA7_9BACL|nr:glutaminase [Brevibacillus fulvus]MBM7591420.1 glutaminase [Brevibacillus fulvus]